MWIKLKSSIKNHWVLATALTVLWSALFFLLISALRRNGGNFILGTDDNYILMAMAKNLVLHGNWSVDIKTFTSSSSSHLWVLLLSTTYLIFGVNEFSPFILNLISATFLIILVYFLLRKYLINNFFLLFILLSIIFFTPLTSLIFTGQEHTMHALITILYVYISAEVLSDDNPGSKKYIFLLILTPLLISARYEGLFLLFIISILFFLRKRILFAFFLLVIGFLPILIYGIFSISKGWYFLPNSILLKGQMPDFSSLNGVMHFLGFSGIQQMISNLPVLFLFVTSVLLLIFSYTKQKDFWKSYRIMLMIFIILTFLHMQFARTGSFFRYESYLVALGIFVISVGLKFYFVNPVKDSDSKKKMILDKFSFRIIKNKIPQSIAISVSILILLTQLVKRGETALKIIPKATNNIYEQQYQMGLFLQSFYQGNIIALNDIGAVSYLSDIECVDLAGLGSMEIASFMRNNSVDQKKIYDLTKEKNVKIAIVYDNWFIVYGGLPPQWTKVGEWTISNNVIVASPTVSFYAVDSSETGNLINNLQTFSIKLPKDVKQSGKYVNHETP